VLIGGDARRVDTMPVVVRFGRLGDLVLQTPLLHLLHARFGEPCRLVTAGAWATPLLSGHPDVGSIWPLRRRHAPLLLSPERWRLAVALRRCLGPIYVSENSPRQLAKIRRLFRLAGIAREQCVFLEDIACPPEHWVDRLLQLGRLTPRGFVPQFGHAAAGPWRAPRLFLDAADRADREAWLRRRDLAGRPIVLVQTGNKRAIKLGRPRQDDSKAWPVPCWAQLLRAIAADLPDACIVLCGSAAETPLLKTISRAAALARVSVATTGLPLRRLLALMETAHSMVSVDTGPAHMAAAIGCPLVVLYGAESPRVWGRRSATGSVIVELGDPTGQDSVSRISPDHVVQAWREVARTAGRSPRSLPAPFAQTGTVRLRAAS
jgi:heptosyltransferase-2/heptosyltransferase-3